MCEVTDSLTIAFASRQDIKATFSCDDVQLELQCGEQLRRTAVYLDKVTGRKPGGALQLDVPAIRQRQKDVGSVYIPKGPHHFVTPAPGVGILPTLLKALPSDCALLPTISDLSATQARLMTMSPSLTSLSATAVSGSLSSTSSSLGSTKRSIYSREGMEDFGEPPMSDTQKHLQRTLVFDGKKSSHKARRLKLPTMSVLDVSKKAQGDEAPSDTLMVLCLMADWSPACHRLHGQLAGAHYQLKQETSQSPTCPASRIQMYHVDASESNALQQQYGFRTVPMMLMFYQGSLVAATNHPRYKNEMHAAMLEALDKGRRKEFLADNFSLNGVGNTMLDGIRADMSLLRGV